jgi:hypothetical protein
MLDWAADTWAEHHRLFTALLKLFLKQISRGFVCNHTGQVRLVRQMIEFIAHPLIKSKPRQYVFINGIFFSLLLVITVF